MKAIIVLKKLALNPEAKITDVLRHAYAISESLNIQDFRNWCKNELTGYNDSKDTLLPEYRYIGGTLHGMNIITGSHHILNSEGITYAIREGMIFFQEFLSKNQNSYDLILPIDIQKNLKTMISTNSDHFSIYQKIDRSSFETVVDFVRTMILEFALDLENKGIIGEEWEFTAQEKIMTQHFTYNINNIGNMANHAEGSTINQKITNNIEVKVGDFNSLASNLRSYGIEESDIQDLQHILVAAPLPESPNDYNDYLNNWIKKMIGKTIDGSWQIATGAAGTLLATGLQNYFGIIS